MVVYKAQGCCLWSSEPQWEIYFDSFEKAVAHCRKNGFYRSKKQRVGHWWSMDSPFQGMTLLKVGNFLLDVSAKWINGEDYDDDDLWNLPCDYMNISVIEVQ